MGEARTSRCSIVSVDNGCKLRNIPHDFSLHTTVSNFYYTVVKSGLWQKLLVALVRNTREQTGRPSEQSYGIIDSQNVKTTGSAQERGIYKKTKGHKRHIVTNTMGNLLAVVVHDANINDTKAGIIASK